MSSAKNALARTASEGLATFWLLALDVTLRTDSMTQETLDRIATTRFRRTQRFCYTALRFGWATDGTLSAHFGGTAMGPPRVREGSRRSAPVQSSYGDVWANPLQSIMDQLSRPTFNHANSSTTTTTSEAGASAGQIGSLSSKEHVAPMPAWRSRLEPRQRERQVQRTEPLCDHQSDRQIPRKASG
jgi:hypothetical protein